MCKIVIAEGARSTIRSDRRGDRDIVTEQEDQPPINGGLPRRFYKATGYGARVLKACEMMRSFLAGNPIGSDVLDNAVVATQTIFHDAEMPSAVGLG